MRVTNNHVFKFKELVIGGTLKAVLYAYINNCPLVYTRLSMPHRFDNFDENPDIFNIPDERTTLFSNKGDIIHGQPKSILLKKCMFLLSVAGLVPFSDAVNGIHLLEDGTVKVVGTRTYKAEVEKVFVFDDHNLHGSMLMPNGTKGSNKNLVLDWIHVRRGLTHKFDCLFGEGDFVKKIMFYPSERICGNNHMKDAVAISHLTDKELLDPDYGELYVRFKVEDTMKKAGIKGKRNGFRYGDRNRPTFLQVRLDIPRREVFPQESIKYEPLEDIKFPEISLEKLIISATEINSESDDEIYVHKLGRRLFK